MYPRVGFQTRHDIPVYCAFLVYVDKDLTIHGEIPYQRNKLPQILVRQYEDGMCHSPL